MSGLRVDYFNCRIVLGGPERSEQAARARLAQVLYEGFAEGYEPRQARPDHDERAWEGLIECDYLHFSGKAEEWAWKIAKTVPYQVKGNRITLEVVSLDATYTNERKPTKWWCRIRDGRQTVEPGDVY